MTEDQGHARLSPSSAHRWCLCPASVNRSEGLPDEESEEAERGTEAHAFLEAMIKRVEYKSPIPSLIDATDMAAVHETLEYITNQTAGNLPAKSEVTVDIGKMFGRDDCWGTMDTQMFKGHEIELLDYKNGMMVVEPFENPQLLLYGIGVMQTFANPFPDDYPIKLTIGQPRAHALLPHPNGAFRSWTVTYGELIGKWATYFRKRMAATDDPNAPANPSTEACRWCRAKSIPGRCPEIENQSLAAAQAIFAPMVTEDLKVSLQDNVSREPSEMAPEQIVFILDHEKMIIGWLEAVKKFAREQAIQGQVYLGQKLVSGPGSRTWKDKDGKAVSAELRKLTKKDGIRISKVDTMTETVISFPQAEKKLKPLVNEATWEKVEAMMTSTKGKPALAPISDPRKAIASAAKDVFAEATQTPAELPSFLL